jgi:hypothetical protein
MHVIVRIASDKGSSHFPFSFLFFKTKTFAHKIFKIIHFYVKAGNCFEGRDRPATEKVIVYPPVLLSIVDNYNRVARDTNKRVVGGSAGMGSIIHGLFNE